MNPLTDLYTHREIALAEGEYGKGDLGEGEILGGTAGALFPIEEEFAVAVGEAGGRVYVECGEGLVDPGGGSFEFGVGADGSFVDDEMCGDGSESAEWDHSVRYFS